MRLESDLLEASQPSIRTRKTFAWLKQETEHPDERLRPAASSRCLRGVNDPVVRPSEGVAGLRSPFARVWGSGCEVALNCVDRLSAASGAGEDERPLERGE
jgi:hypothetical protein